MQIIIDSKTVSLDLPPKDVQLKQVIEEVEAFLFEVGKVPVALKIDDKVLTQQELLRLQEEVLSGDEVLDFGVVSVFKFLQDNLEGAASANEQLIAKIKSFAADVAAAKTPSTTDELVGELQNFFDFWLKLRRLLPDEFNVISVEGKPFDKVFDELRDLLKEIVGALEEKDYILATDLLQYEVVPSVEAVDKAIPELNAKLGLRAARDDKAAQT